MIRDDVMFVWRQSNGLVCGQLLISDTIIHTNICICKFGKCRDNVLRPQIDLTAMANRAHLTDILLLGFMPITTHFMLFKISKTKSDLIDCIKVKYQAHHGALMNIRSKARVTMTFLVEFNSLVSGKFEWSFRFLILWIIYVIDGWGISCKLALRWMSLDLTDDKTTLVQVMAWCVRQQAITWADVDPDLCRHMASLGPNELT